MAEKWFQSKYRVKVDNKSKFFGVTDTKRRTIIVNKKKSKATGQRGEVLDSILHETLHARHPQKSERRIEKMTARSEKRIGKKQKSKLYNLINK
jgi:hypothetical protein